jgi:glycosyltransferase involved in cell wall biosynthesis
VVIHVPIYVDGGRQMVSTEWKRSLELLRDSLGGVYGPVVVLAPTLPVGCSEQAVERVSAEDGILLEEGFDLRVRARGYWLEERGPWRRRVRQLAAGAAVVHAGLDDVYRPIMFDGFAEAVAAGRPTVFVQDTDVAGRIVEQHREDGWRLRMRSRLYAGMYRRWCRWGVRSASLSLLKGRGLMRVYGGQARNGRLFHDTSYMRNEMVAERVVAERVGTLMGGRALRLVYCGRLVERKGVMWSVEVVEAARRMGCDVRFDVIGSGPEEGSIARRVGELGLGERVRMLGPMGYGAGLIGRLAEYDAVLFTPPVEDTPRMIFDGYAAGLPLIGTDIDYVVERSEEERAAVVVKRGDVAGAAREIVSLDRQRGRLAELARRALAAGEHHAADHWYQRRAEWTFEIAPPPKQPSPMARRSAGIVPVER